MEINTTKETLRVKTKMQHDVNQFSQMDIDNESQKADVMFDNMHNLLDKAHRLIKVYTSAKDVNKTIKEYDREKAIQLIAQNINKYEGLLNLLSTITGRYIIYQPNFYDDKPDKIILCDLKYIRNVIYFDEIKNAGLDAALKKILKKLNLIS